MKNLEQVRARNALAVAKDYEIKGKHGGEVIKKVPSHIINHGLLATCAYSYNENEGWLILFNAIAKHLSDPDIAILPARSTTRDELMNVLTGPQSSSELLRRATSETMAWLSYARRFVKKDKAGK